MQNQIFTQEEVKFLLCLRSATDMGGKIISITNAESRMLLNLIERLIDKQRKEDEKNDNI